MRFQTKSGFGGRLGLGLALVSLFLAGCPKKPLRPSSPPSTPVIHDLPSLLNSLREQGEKLKRAEARAEITGEGIPSLGGGRFYGLLGLQRRTSEEIGLALQVYTLVGAPILEFIALGERLQVFLPLEQTMFMNFTELLPSAAVEEMPVTSFSAGGLPLSLIPEQIKLIWGLGFSSRYRYEFFQDNSYILREWEGDQLRRQIEYTKTGLQLTRVIIYEEGVANASMTCREHGDPTQPAGLLPRRIEIQQGKSVVRFLLSEVRVNEEVTAPDLSFRAPSPQQKVILLTPPVP